MRYLIYLGHPAQYLFLRETIKRLKNNGHRICILIKTKDILEALLLADGVNDYKNILLKERGTSLISIAFSLIKRLIAMIPIVLRFKPDVLIGTDPSIAQLGFFLRINRITITEDDYNIIKPLAFITYPFTQTIFCPEPCNVGRWGHKKIGYQGYMKLGHLHPKVFQIDNSIKMKYNLPPKFVLIRLSKLSAYHDIGIKGINEKTLDNIVMVLKKNNYDILISAENLLDKKYNHLLLNINPNDVHSILGFSSFLISDSQSMSVEAAILGIPSIRVSSFSGKISVLEELEHKYKLTYGIKASDSKKLFELINKLIKTKDLQKIWTHRSNKMLNNKINVTAFLFWFLENYPSSNTFIRKNPNYQFHFK